MHLPPPHLAEDGPAIFRYTHSSIGGTYGFFDLHFTSSTHLVWFQALHSPPTHRRAHRWDIPKLLRAAHDKQARSKPGFAHHRHAETFESCVELAARVVRVLKICTERLLFCSTLCCNVNERFCSVLSVVEAEWSSSRRLGGFTVLSVMWVQLLSAPSRFAVSHCFGLL